MSATCAINIIAYCPEMIMRVIDLEREEAMEALITAT
jgi:hypothetical protein